MAQVCGRSTKQARRLGYIYFIYYPVYSPVSCYYGLSLESDLGCDTGLLEVTKNKVLSAFVQCSK